MSTTCPGCGLVSHNPNDAAAGWCDRCKMGDAERAVAPRLLEALGIACADPDKLDMLSLQTLAYVNEQGYAMLTGFAARRQWIAVRPFMYTAAIIRGSTHDQSGISDQWCYHNLDAAMAAIDVWDGLGDPAGWHRHPRSGRRKAETDDKDYDENDQLVKKGELYVRW